MRFNESSIGTKDRSWISPHYTIINIYDFYDVHDYILTTSRRAAMPRLTLQQSINDNGKFITKLTATSPQYNMRATTRVKLIVKKDAINYPKVYNPSARHFENITFRNYVLLLNILLSILSRNGGLSLIELQDLIRFVYFSRAFGRKVANRLVKLHLAQNSKDDYRI